MSCRFCGEILNQQLIDLGVAPPSNDYLNPEDLKKPELFFPLKVFVCNRCWLVQTEDCARAGELFQDDYAYFSSTSATWVEHAARYAEMICTRLEIDHESLVVEIASNDGYLLKNFLSRGIPCLGVEPAAGTAAVAERLGIPVLREFFTAVLAQRLAAEGKLADLIIGNNVYAHVPDIKDFTAGIRTLLKPGGTVTLEFPHLLRLIEAAQFDTIYHEHYSYLSLHTVSRIFAAVRLRVCDVEELPTHGGSLRVYGCHDNDPRGVGAAVGAMLKEEERRGLCGAEIYRGFQAGADRIKDQLLLFLIGQKQEGKKVAAYGAAAKGNTLLNYAGVKPDLIPYVCDAAPSKQGKFLPGSHIPIVPPTVLREMKPDLVLILPWNIADEIMSQHGYVKEWGGSFVLALPEMRILGGSI